MQLKLTTELRPNAGAGGTRNCRNLGSCRRILTQIRQAKEAIFAEWRESLQPREHMLELALTEAEALAWQTEYPHLLFPALASEKAQSVAAWNRHQQSLQLPDPEMALAA